MENSNINLNPGSIFLTIEDGRIVNAQTKNGGDDNFVRYTLNELEKVRPGTLIPNQAIIRYDFGNKRDEVLRGLDLTKADYATNEEFMQRIEKYHQSSCITLCEAFFCLANDIPLLDDARDNRFFLRQNGFEDFVRNFRDCAPDVSSQVAEIKDKLPDIVPGYFYVSFDADMWMKDSEVAPKSGGLSFSDYIQRNLDDLEPGEPLPSIFVARYEFDDITPLKDNPMDDKDVFLVYRVFPIIREQRSAKPKACELVDVVFCIQNGINPLETTRIELMKRPDYQNDIKRIRASVPAGLKIESVLPSNTEKNRKTVQHVPSRLQDTKQTPKL